MTQRTRLHGESSPRLEPGSLVPRPFFFYAAQSVEWRRTTIAWHQGGFCDNVIAPKAVNDLIFLWEPRQRLCVICLLCFDGFGLIANTQRIYLLKASYFLSFDETVDDENETADNSRSSKFRLLEAGSFLLGGGVLRSLPFYTQHNGISKASNPRYTIINIGTFVMQKSTEFPCENIKVYH